MSRSPSRLRRNISFAEDIQCYETYSNEVVTFRLLFRSVTKPTISKLFYVLINSDNARNMTEDQMKICQRRRRS